MSNLRQAAQQALEALKCGDTLFYPQTRIAISALIEALAEPNQEPVFDCPRCGHCCPQIEQDHVAWMEMVVSNLVREGVNKHKARQLAQHFTAPPQRKPLTEEEIEQSYRHIWSNIPENFDHTSMGWIEQGIRYAEQAHGIGEKK